MHREHVGADGDEGDRPQIALLEAAVLRGGEVGGEARGRRQQRVAVGRGACDRLGGELPPAPPRFSTTKLCFSRPSSLLDDQPADDVGEPAGRERDDDGDVLRRIALRGGGLPRGSVAISAPAASTCNPSLNDMILSLRIVGRTLDGGRRERQCGAR